MKSFVTLHRLLLSIKRKFASVIISTTLSAFSVFFYDRRTARIKVPILWSSTSRVVRIKRRWVTVILIISFNYLNEIFVISFKSHYLIQLSQWDFRYLIQKLLSHSKAIISFKSYYLIQFGEKSQSLSHWGKKSL